MNCEESRMSKSKTELLADKLEKLLKAWDSRANMDNGARIVDFCEANGSTIVSALRKKPKP